MQSRTPLTETLLSLFVPFYLLYWFYVTAAVLRQRGTSPPPLKLIFLPIVVLFGVLLLQVAVTFISSSIIVNLVSLLLGFVGMIGAMVCPYIYFYKFAVAADHATQEKVSTIVGFVLFMFASPAAVYLIQDALNTTPALPITNPPTSPIGPVQNPVVAANGDVTDLNPRQF